MKTFFDHITLYITNKCNLACEYCFVRHGKMSIKFKKETLPLNIGKMTIDFLLSKKISGDLERVRLVFFGGEPLLAFSLIKKLVAYGKKQARRANKKIGFSIVTNGLLVNPEILDFCDKNKMTIILSCDGARPSQDRHRVFPDGKGSFTTLRKKFPLLASYSRAKVRITFTPETIHNLYHDIFYLRKCGFKIIGLSGVDLHSWKSSSLKMLENELIKIGTFWIKEWKKKKNFWIIPLSNNLLKAERSNIMTDKNPTGRLRSCSAGKAGLSVNTNGDIYPCYKFASQLSYKLGSVMGGISKNGQRLLTSLQCSEKNSCPALSLLTTGKLDSQLPSTDQFVQVYQKVIQKLLGR